MMNLRVISHPSLVLRAFRTDFPEPLAALATPGYVLELLSGRATAPVSVPDGLAAAIRQMLRWGGFKPSGRSKPSSEYLVSAVSAGRLPSINLAVDVCNAVSLCSGFPISVVDLDQLQPPLHVAIATAGQRYVFNASGQEIDLEGLLCLYDALGPCANAVKDAQRVKTSATTRSTLSLIWGCRQYAEQLAQADTWYQQLLSETGARLTGVAIDIDTAKPL
jgi:DNA/RNA-binding domain of Phe-tRNA-synthetase-like protein